MKRFLLFVCIIIFQLCLINKAGAQTQTMANGANTAAVNFPGTGCVYNWINDNPGIGLPASGTDNIPSFVPVKTNKVTATISTRTTPFGISISEDGTLVYVTNKEYNTVSVIDASTNKVNANIPTGNFPDSFGSFVSNPKRRSTISFTITVAATPPSITAGPVSGTISACFGSASASPNIQQFKVSGSGLNGDISVSAPVGFEVSVSAGSGYGSSVAISPTGGIVNSVPLYVRSAASASIGNISDYVGLSSFGVTRQNILVKGVINALPTVNTVPDQTKANGQPVADINFTGTANTYNWVNNTPSIGLAASGTGDITSFTAVNTGNGPVVAKITVTPVNLGFAYIANTGSNNVSVFNTATNTLVTTITVGRQPFGTAVSPDGSRVYVTNSLDNTVSVIDTKSNTVLATIGVSVKPQAIVVSADGNFVYVSDRGLDSVSIIDAKTNSVVGLSQLPKVPAGLAVSPDGSVVYVVDSGSDIISVMSSNSYHRENAILVGSAPNGIAMNADGSRLYVTNSGSNTVSVVNTATSSEIATIKVGSNPYGISISPDGSLLYVTNSGSDNVSVIDIAGNKVISTIPVGKKPYGISISPDGGLAYVINNGSDNMSVVDTKTNLVTSIVAVGSSPASLGNFIKAGSNCSGAPVTFTITVNPNTKPTIFPGPASGNISACVGTASVSPDIQQVKVSAINLTADITITAPQGFEVSLSLNSGYAGTVTIVQTGGKVSGAVVYVRSAASALAGVISGNIIFTSAGAVDQNEAVTGFIKELPVVDQVTDQTAVNGTPTKPIAFTGTGSRYNWTNDTPGIGLPASGTGDISSFTAVNKGNSDVKATIIATPQPAGYAYIANGDDNGVVTVVNAITKKIVSTIKVGGYPFGVAATPNGRFVYVTNSKDNTISVINTASNTVVAIIPVGIGPHGIAISQDGSKVFVTYGEDDTIVSVISTNTNTVIDNIPSSYWNYGISVSHDGSKIYVVNNVFNTLAVINTATDMVEASIPSNLDPYIVEDSYGVVDSPDGNMLYVTNPNSNTVSVISTATNAIIATIPVGKFPNVLFMSPDGSQVYVANGLSNDVSVINTATNKVITTIKVGSYPYGIALSPDGKTLYVTNREGNDVSIINSQTNTLTDQITIGLHPTSFGNFIIGPTGCNGIPIKFTITVSPSPHPAITVTGILPPLSTIYGTASAAAMFSVSGVNITDGILVTPPQGFEVSTDNLTFSNTVIVKGAGIIVSTKVYIRLASTTHFGSYQGNIILSSKDAGNINESIPTSNVSSAPLTITADNKSKTSGDTNPVLTITYKGFVNNDGPAQLLTQPVIKTTAVTASVPGEYPIMVNDAKSPDYNITNVDGVLTVVKGIEIPNTFTPNGDGINDTWNIENLGSYPNCTVTIYNRYGENVYSSIGYGVPWNGTQNGSSLPWGTYYYIINLKNDSKLLSGYLVIIR